MKILLLLAVVFCFVTVANAGLVKINEASIFIEDNKLVVPHNDANVPDGMNPVVYNNLHNNQANIAQNNTLNTPMAKGSLQDLTSALPKVEANGVNIQLQGQSISYGVMDVGMGDFAKGGVFNKMPEIKR